MNLQFSLEPQASENFFTGINKRSTIYLFKKCTNLQIPYSAGFNALVLLLHSPRLFLKQVKVDGHLFHVGNAEKLCRSRCESCQVTQVAEVRSEKNET